MRAISAVLLVWAALAAAQTPEVTVPFVGCPVDGQLGLQDPPTGNPERVALDPAVASRMAYYAGRDGVLAPRGWQCFGNVGSSGTVLMVAPRPMTGSPVFLRRLFEGPFVLVSFTGGDGSGRHQVAETIVRAALGRPQFLNRVSELFPFPPDFPKGPYPTDRLMPRTVSIVEYRTPAHTEGLGTPWWIKPDNRPIDGVVMILGEPRYTNVVLLAMRLPGEFESLAPAISRHLQNDAIHWE